ncbi:hypothetical protein DAX92_28740, partial [Salmonella enterica subsp. enterica]
MTGNSGTALGVKAKVTAENSVALGFESVASRADEVNIGGKNNTGRYLGGVKEGVHNDDAVNLKQMNSAKKEAISTANKHSDENLKSANTYTDTAKKEAISTANKHSDE